jgi:restriction endonuclease Mrr
MDDVGKRGYEFERFLHDLFAAYGFNPRPSFRIEGEQIDGSIEFDHEFYLIEAKWQAEPVRESDLLVLQGRVAGHSAFGRGIFITAGSFSPEGVRAYQRLQPSSMIGIDGQDLYLTLEDALPLSEVLRWKLRRLVEGGDFHLPVIEFRAQLSTRRR